VGVADLLLLRPLGTPAERSLLGAECGHEIRTDRVTALARCGHNVGMPPIGVKQPRAPGCAETKRPVDWDRSGSNSAYSASKQHADPTGGSAGLGFGETEARVWAEREVRVRPSRRMLSVELERRAHEGPPRKAEARKARVAPTSDGSSRPRSPKNGPPDASVSYMLDDAGHEPACRVITLSGRRLGFQ
jgi:hypothetical protein